jgi:hypothetical protein
MAIAQRPKKSTPAPVLPDEEQERRIEAFISGAKTDAEPPPAVEETRMKPTPVRFDPAVLPVIDAAAKRRGLSRAAWVRFVVSQALEEGRV